jgi:cation diffusion facilitator CzcD-associated flavoprotein CzcO
MNRPYPTGFKALVRRLPAIQRLWRNFWFQYCELLTVGIRHPRTVGRLLGLRSSRFMRKQVPDPELRAKIWPNYTFGCKRVLFSSFFLPTLAQPNVELVTEAIDVMTPTGIVTADGRQHEADCVIWATGFKTMEFMFPMEITGTEGRDLREAWAGGPHAHLGMTVPGFPSMFIMYGPNTNTSGGSIIFYHEAQASYIRQALQQLERHGGGAIEVRPEVEAASDSQVQSWFEGTAWTGCNSWYRDAGGRIVSNWPSYMREYSKRTRHFDPAEYRFAPRPAPVAA